MVARVVGMATVALMVAMVAPAEPAKETYCNGRPKVYKGLQMYPHGRPVQIGEVFLFPNGRPTRDEDESLLYANGRRLVDEGYPLYPNGQIMFAAGVSYYPNRAPLFRNGVFHDHKGKPTNEPVTEVSIRWKELKYDFTVVDRVASQNRIRVSYLDKGVMISFVLDNGAISDVTATCAPAAIPTPKD